MADMKISQLTDGGASQATDEYVVARSGNNFRIDGASVAAAATSVGTLTSLTVSGTATAGKFAPTANTVTGDGMYLPTTETLAFSTGGSERLRINAAGYVGITSDNPLTKLHIAGNNSGSTSDNPAVTTLRFEDIDTSTAANQPIGKIEWYGNDASGPGVMSYILSKAADTNGGGDLRFATAASAGTATERMRLDSAGNLGLGVTPSAWTAGYNSIQFASQLAIGPAGLSRNGYYDGAWKYITTSTATLYQPSAGAHVFYTAPSGTAGNPITFTQAMTLDASGQLGIGTTSPQSPLQAVGHIKSGLVSNSDNTKIGGLFLYGATTNANRRNWAILPESDKNGMLGFWVSSANNTEPNSGTQVLSISSSGNLGVGTTTFGTSAAKVLGLANATEPSTAVADTIQFYSVDLSAGNTIPALRCEGTGVTDAAITNVTVTNKIAIKVNGTVYYLLATTSAS